MPFLSSGQTRTGSPASTSGTALYASSGSAGGSQIIQGSVEITGNLVVDDNFATDGNAFIGNGITGGVVNIGNGNTVLTPSGTGGLTVATTLPGSTATITLAGSLGVGNGAIGGVVNLGAGNTVLTPSGAGGLTVSTTLPGATASVSLNGNLNVGNGLLGGVLNIGGGNSIFTPNGAGNLALSSTLPGTTATLGIPQIANGSLFSVPSVPIPVASATSGLPSGTFVIAGLRVMWGSVVAGSTNIRTVNFTPAFGGSPCLLGVPEAYGGTVGYACVSAISASTANFTLTTSGGTGFNDTACYWFAIGPA
jgi:hypothetical protein